MATKALLTRIPRPRFSLLTLVLGVVFASACFGLWWRWKPWEVRRILPPMCRASFSPDGLFAVTDGNSLGDAEILDLKTGRVMASLKSRGNLGSARFAPDGRTILTAHDDKTLAIWDVASGRRIRTLPCAENALLAEFSPDGESAIVCALGKPTSIQRIQDGKAMLSLDMNGFCGRFFPHGKRVAVLDHEQPTLADLSSVRLTPETQVLARGIVKVLDLNGGKELFRLTNGTDTGVAFFDISRDGTRLLTVSDGSAMCVWDAQDGRALLQTEWPKYVDHPMFFPRSTLALSVTRSERGGSARVWDTSTGHVMDEIPLEVYAGLSDVAMSPDGNQLLLCYSGADAKKSVLYSRRRPEHWWGIAWLPEFWVALIAGGALAFVAARNLRCRLAISRLNHLAQRATRREPGASEALSEGEWAKRRPW